jgi:hypothetical protein
MNHGGLNDHGCNMRNISEKDLGLFINLLSNKLAQLQQEYEASEKNPDKLDDSEMDELYQLQELIDQYKFTLGNLRPEYQAGLADGFILPSFEELTQNFPLPEQGMA